MAEATPKPLKITEVVLRDAHQSLLATRLRIDDMLPICEKLDGIGFWSIESWGGATFDACVRYLGEDPWQRLRQLKAAMPKTPQQMLLRGQNLLGYRHYADDVVDTFVERCAINGIDVFRIFDAMNDMRNLRRAVQAVLRTQAHAQGTISYTTSPVHTLDTWVDLAKQIEDMGAHSLCIKDMAGLLKPYEAYELVSRLKASTQLPVQLHSHATTGLSVATLVKAAEAGIDSVDTAISSMSMTYGHSATETIVASLQDTQRDTGLDLVKLEEVAAYFREVRKKYAQFEGSLKGVDSRILIAQVPGGMLTNMESQLKEQDAADKFDEVIQEIPRVREDLGFIPLVTPTSQIVGTQAVINVIQGERYKTITKETAGVLKGEYGATPASVNPELQARVLEGSEPVTCRPADLLMPEMDKLIAEVTEKAQAEGVVLVDNRVEDALIHGMFAQVGWKFLANRGNPAAFEPEPGTTAVSSPSVTPVILPKPTADTDKTVASYTVNVDGRNFNVMVGPGGTPLAVQTLLEAPQHPPKSTEDGAVVYAPMAGNILKILVSEGSIVAEGQIVVIMEAMKMETEVRSKYAGIVSAVQVKEGGAVAAGSALITL